MPPSASQTSAVQRAMYVACNVYLSAGGDKGHGAILLHLLKHAQSLAASLDHHQEVGVVHAYADPVYNRSSFHLVGHAESLAVVAADLSQHALLRLRAFGSKSTAKPQCEHQEAQHDHPYVGLVDHIAIMPIQGTNNDNSANVESLTTGEDHNDFTPQTLSGIAARHVGRVLEEAGVQVYYYGSAHPDGTSLATIRREKTKFFQSGGLDASATDTSNATLEVATVGAPLGFVENYNIRLRATCPKQIAQSLTKQLRERDGGLPGVEALTLPYSDGRWEVACNLLCPEKASAADIDRMVAEWQT